MISRKLTSSLLCLLAAFSLTACNGSDSNNQADAADTTPKKVTFTVQNDTGQEINSVGINSSSKKMTPMSYGTIAKNKSETLKNKFVPAIVGVHWSKKNKRRTSQSVKIYDALGTDYQGPVHLIINKNDTVTVK